MRRWDSSELGFYFKGLHVPRNSRGCHSCRCSHTSFAPGFLAAPAKFASETNRRNSLGSIPTRLSLVPRVMQIEPNMPDLHRNHAGISECADWVAEREGFEPPEPLGSPDFESGRLNQTPEPLRDRRASMFAPAQSS